MKRIVRAVAAITLVGAVAVLVGAPPAGAAISVVGSGTVATVTVTGDAMVTFGCSGGTFVVTSAGVATPSSPAVACSTMTKVQVNGDGGAQYVVGYGLDYGPSFPAHPYLSVNLGDGADTVIDTAQADSLTMGDGNDRIQLNASGLVNPTNSLGTGTYDSLLVVGSELADSFTITSGSPNVSVRMQNSSVDRTNIATGIEEVDAVGNGANDVIDATGISALSTITRLVLDGGPGTNTLTTGQEPATFANGGFGSGTMTGSPGYDLYYSMSASDVIHTNGGGDSIIDQYGPHSGGRTIDGVDTGSSWTNWTNTQNDVVARVRPSVGSASVAVSLSRSGLQVLPAGFNAIVLDMSYPSARDELAMADIVLPNAMNTSVVGDSYDNDLADITIPSGGWSTSGSPATSMTITPSGAGLQPVFLQNIGPLSIHGPWTNANQGFAHRVTRDLVFRFLTGAQRTAIADALTAGTKTRASVVHDLIFSDEYRGLDVDRIFRRFLKRDPDPSGKTYWINRIREGRSLRVFRAQLFGGGEYFTKAGSTNDGFVRSAYNDVLGRFPDPSGQAYWVHKLETGTSRATVANYFLGSTEARRTIVKEQFLRFLDRYPTTSEIDVWMEPLRTSATGEQDLIAFLATSGAYYGRT